jgi:protocatechuate 3,4-dioxygenase beta subunit
MNKDRSKIIMSRRQTLRLLGAAGATAFVAWAGEPAARLLPAVRRNAVAKAAALDCIVRPSLTEGPYFVDEKLNRSDIRTDPTTGAASAGVPLVIQFQVTGLGGGNCAPVPNAYVDIWHCDAAGTYSDVTGAVGKKFLRGYQVTDSNGIATFTTIYPGWYSGRAVHIHFKIRLYAGSQKTYEFTSQFFFEPSVTSQVYSQSPYSAKGSPDTSNSRDGIYNQGGSQLLLTPTANGSGYAVNFTIGLQGVTGTTPTPGAAPTITGASITGKQLIVTGSNFGTDAVLLMNGEKQKKTSRDELNPTTTLIARKSGKFIATGQTVSLQVQNSADLVSNEYLFTRLS